MARSYDTAGTHLVDVLRRAAHHRGTAFVEILQNCNVFNDAAFEHITNKASASANQLRLEHGKPLIYGEAKDKGLALEITTLKLAKMESLESNGLTKSLLLHDETNPMLAQFLASLAYPEYPVPLGVLYANSLPTYEEQLQHLDFQASEKSHGGLESLLKGGRVWQVPAA